MIKWRNDYLNPRPLKTVEDVEEANKHEKEIGGKIVWKLGDTCYFVKYTGYTKGHWH